MASSSSGDPTSPENHEPSQSPSPDDELIETGEFAPEPTVEELEPLPEAEADAADMPAPAPEPAPEPRTEPSAALPPPQRGPVLRSPDEWGAEKGMIKRASQPWQVDTWDWRHTAAAVLHGWGGAGQQGGYQYHEGKAFSLSEADYDAAIRAVESDMKPHLAARTKYAPATDTE